MNNTRTLRKAIQVGKYERRYRDIAKKEKLIMEVKKRPAIWDQRCEEHRDRQKVDEMWEEVTEAMNDQVASKTECKRLWKNIYDHFRNLYTGLISATNYNSAIEVKAAIKSVQWRHFQRLLFLKDIFEKHRINSKIPAKILEILDEAPTNNGVKDLSCDEPELMHFDVDTGEINFSEPSTSACGMAKRPSLDSSTNDTEDLVMCQSPASNSPKAKRQSRSKRAMKRSYDFNKLSKQLRKPEDETVLFGKYLAVVVRRVPEDMRHKCETMLIEVANAFINKKVPLIVIPDNEKDC